MFADDFFNARREKGNIYYIYTKVKKIVTTFEFNFWSLC